MEIIPMYLHFSDIHSTGQNKKKVKATPSAPASTTR